MRTSKLKKCMNKKLYKCTTVIAFSLAIPSFSFAVCGSTPGTSTSVANGPLTTDCSVYDPKELQFSPSGTHSYRCNQAILSSRPRVNQADTSFFDGDELIVALSQEHSMLGILNAQSDRASVQLNTGKVEDVGFNEALAWGRWSQGQMVQLPEVRGGGGRIITTTTLSPDVNIHYAVGIESRVQFRNDVGMGRVPFNSKPLPECKESYHFVAATRPTIDGRDQDGKAVDPGQIEHADMLTVDFQDRNSAVAHFRVRIGKLSEDTQLALKRLPREDRYSGGEKDRLVLGEIDPKGGVRDCPAAPSPDHVCFNAAVRGYFYGRKGEYLAIKYHMPADHLLPQAAKGSRDFRYRYNTISGILIYQRN